MAFGTTLKLSIAFVVFLTVLSGDFTNGAHLHFLNRIGLDKPSPPALQAEQNDSREGVRRNHQNDEIIHYYPLSSRPIIFTRVLSPSDIYAFSENSVIHFDGIKWTVVYSFANAIILSADCDGKYAIFSLDSTRSRSLTCPYIFASRITRERNKLKMSSPVLLNIGISEQPNIFFKRPASALVGGIMDLGLLKLSYMRNGDKFRFYLKRYPSDAVTYYGDISFCKSTRGSSTFAYTSRYVAKIEGDGDELSLKRIIDLNRFCRGKSEQDATLDNPTLSFLDSSFGVIRSCNNLLVYFRGEKDSSTDVKVIVDPPFTPKDVRSICVVSSREFWLITTDGTLMRADRNGENFDSWQWEKIGAIPDVGSNYLLTCVDSNKILAAGSSVTIFSRKITPLEWRNGFTKGTDASLFSLFTFSSMTNYGVGIRDFNNDGVEDVVMVSIVGANQLYLLTQPIDPFVNNLDRYLVSRGLKSVNGRLGTSDYSEDVAVTSGDINEDGSEDVIVTSVSGPNVVYLNNGAGYFRDVTDAYGLSGNLNRSEGAVLADVNNDGYLDLFETSFNGSDKLFLNDHGGAFKDVTEASGLSSRGSSITAVFSDINGDGFPDLYVGNWGNQNRMYRNNGNGTFTDVTDLSGTGCGMVKKTNSVLFADFNNDGKPDLFVGNKGSGNRLFINEGNFHFRDVSRECGAGDTMYTYGAVYGDFNNDGLLDLIVVGLSGIKIYQNMYIDTSGVPHFRDISPQCALPQEYINGYNTGAATFDLNNDGNLDVIVSQFNGRSFLLRNNFSSLYRKNRRFIEVKVEGCESNRDGIGAKLFLYHNGKLASFREVSSSYGYASSSSKIQHFGIPDPEGKYELKVVFPASRVVKTVGVLPGKMVTVREYSGIRESYYLWKKGVLLWLYSGNLEKNIRDFLVFIGILIIFGLFVKSPDGSTYFGYALKLRSSRRAGEFSFIRIAVIAVPVVVYVLVSAMVSLSRKAFLSNLIWMSGNDDFILVGVFPLLMGLSSAVVMAVIDRQISYRKAISKEIVYKLFTRLKSFEHGEGSEMVLERLALFCKNVPLLIDPSEQRQSESDSGSYNIEYIVERFCAVLGEWNEIVRPELESIVSLHKLTEGKNLTNKLNGIAEEIKRSERCISGQTGKLEKLFSSGLSPEKSDLWRRNLLSINEEILHLRKSLRKSFEIVSNVFISDVNKVVRNVANRFQDITFSGINITLNLSGETALAIVDRVELFKVLETLLENAIQAFSSVHNNGQGQLIKLSVAETDLWVKIAVEDNGPGLSDEQMNLAFKKGITTKGNGHGFGLVYAREVIERYGGTIYVDRGYRSGARFVIELRKV